MEISHLIDDEIFQYSTRGTWPLWWFCLFVCLIDLPFYLDTHSQIEFWCKCVKIQASLLCFYSSSRAHLISADLISRDQIGAPPLDGFCPVERHDDDKMMTIDREPGCCLAKPANLLVRQQQRAPFRPESRLNSAFGSSKKRASNLNSKVGFEQNASVICEWITHTYTYTFDIHTFAPLVNQSRPHLCESAISRPPYCSPCLLTSDIKQRCFYVWWVCELVSQMCHSFWFCSRSFVCLYMKDTFPSQEWVIIIMIMSHSRSIIRRSDKTSSSRFIWPFLGKWLGALLLFCCRDTSVQMNNLHRTNEYVHKHNGS